MGDDDPNTIDQNTHFILRAYITQKGATIVRATGSSPIVDLWRYSSSDTRYLVLERFEKIRVLDVWKTNISYPPSLITLVDGEFKSVDHAIASIAIATL